MEKAAPTRRRPRLMPISTALVHLGLAQDVAHARSLVRSGSVQADGHVLESTFQLLGAGVVLTVGTKSAPIHFGGLS